MKDAESVLIALGNTTLSPTVLLHKLTALNKPDHAPEEIVIEEETKPKEKSSPTDFSVLGAKHLLTQLAKCCHPIPGDDIIGFITKDRGISVHQKKCRNIFDAMERRPEKLIDISWENQLSKSYRVNLDIQGEDGEGLLRDISGLIAQFNLSIFALTSRVNTQNSMALIGLTIEVKNLDLLEDIVKKLRQVKGVVSIKRS